VRVLTDASGWFTLEVPDGWDSKTEDCVTTLRSPSGCATVFLSAARHVRGRQESFGGADFLMRFLESLGLEVGEEDIRCLPGDGCRIYVFARSSDAARWRYWSVTDDETALLIGYTADPADRAHADEEEAQVEAMIHSVRLYHSRVH
jgi:hypothetical protein